MGSGGIKRYGRYGKMGDKGKKERGKEQSMKKN